MVRELSFTVDSIPSEARLCLASILSFWENTIFFVKFQGTMTIMRESNPVNMQIYSMTPK